MKGKDINIGRYYLVHSDIRLRGNFIGKCLYVSKAGTQVQFEMIKTQKSFWTHKAYVVHEVEEYDAVLHSLGEIDGNA